MVNRHSKLLRPRVRYVAVGWCVVFALLCASLAIGALADMKGQVLAVQDANRERVAATLTRQAALLNKPIDAEEARQWQAFKVEQDFPWDTVFRSIEETANTNIELLEFSPDKKNRRIFLRGEARDHAALVAYLDALTVRPELHDIYLVRRQSTAREKLTTIGFEIRGSLR